MTQTFVADELIDAARKATGIERFDSESFREGLEVLLADANKMNYPQAGMQRLSGLIIGALSNRLKSTAYLDEHPELLTRPLSDPCLCSAFRAPALPC